MATPFIILISQKFDSQFQRKNMKIRYYCKIQITRQMNNSSNTRDFRLISQRAVSSNAANLERKNNLKTKFNFDWCQIYIILMPNDHFWKWRIAAILIQGSPTADNQTPHTRLYNTVISYQLTKHDGNTHVRGNVIICSELHTGQNKQGLIDGFHRRLFIYFC